MTLNTVLLVLLSAKTVQPYLFEELRAEIVGKLLFFLPSKNIAKDNKASYRKSWEKF